MKENKKSRNSTKIDSVSCTVFAALPNLFASCIFPVYGKEVKALIEQPLEAEPMHPGKNTVTYEARLLKGILLHLG